uniref:Phosphorylase b kinase regulatory subunit n=1 Tax=Daphnia galeata TaxID=27404 RepID=A0A8J2RHM3_9CRUS|nr:unnamed protein product [Daphnia galeata]
MEFPYTSKNKMRSRSGSGVRLEYYQRLVYKTILRYQNPVTGLLPASPTNEHAWIRDNVYSILAVWALSMAYKKYTDMDEDKAKTYELEQRCVKLMRGLLMSMMQQKDKLEKFKVSQNPLDSLHAKYSSSTGATVVTDAGWGHLQIDAISLYLLILSQMTASGLQIVFNLDEVSFVQNLVFYIESSYCVPDYGIWERGDKTNHGLPELNASSIGMAKAALEAVNELDLFGARGGPTSVIHVLADEAQKCQAVLLSMLPRESNSKEVDAALLSVIGFPAFAVDDPELIKLTRTTIQEKLQGRYGFKRFLRDGYKTPKEDPNRLYYEPFELRVFENIECEWPLFFCLSMLDFLFQGDKEAVEEYSEALEEIVIKTEDGLKFVPELYAVSAESVNEEYKCPGSQDRVAVGRVPFMWAQSLYIVAQLLKENFIAPGELDPLNRRLGSQKKPDVVVQVVIVAEDASIQEKLNHYDIQVQTVQECAPIEIQPARVLSHLYTYLGQNKKLNLSGRRSRDVGILSTSKLYALQDRIFAFTPQLTDQDHFYVAVDYELMIDTFKNELYFLKSSWQNMLGRPVVVIVIRQVQLDQGKIPVAMVTTLKKLKSGYINGTRVSLGNLSDFLNTSCLTNLSFLGNSEEGMPDRLNSKVMKYLEDHLHKTFVPRTGFIHHSTQRLRKKNVVFSQNPKRKLSYRGSMRRTRCIQVENLEVPFNKELSSIASSRAPSPGLSISPETEGASVVSIEPRSPSPKEEEPWVMFTRHRTYSDAQYENTEVDELLHMLKDSESLDEQGDILHFLVVEKGIDYMTGKMEDGTPIRVKDLLKDLYEKSCRQKKWSLVRHTAGMLGKRVEDLAKAVTDLLVHQKQVTVGMPPYNERTITAPLPNSELRHLIHQAYGDDDSCAMLTQELVLYLAMFVRTEPALFLEMLRLRVGLIIRVMASELSRSVKCDSDEATELLLNLSPFEMKNLLYHILSGKEFNMVTSGVSGNFSVLSNKLSRVSRRSQIGTLLGRGSTSTPDNEPENAEPDRQGQWIRRRRLDGALNRVPRGFYSRIWMLLERCPGMIIEGKLLSQTLTQEMTSGELKFALQVETVLNAIPQPEYRQLMVEAMMVYSLLAEYNSVPTLGQTLCVERLVHAANKIFLDDQMQIQGDATLCCAKPKEQRELTSTGTLLCGGAAYVCQHFYDSAPSGCYGTMTYLIRALATILDCFPIEGEIDCAVS